MMACSFDRARLGCALLVSGAIGLAAASPASASFGFVSSGANATSVTVSNSANPSDPLVANPNDLDTQAGSHPFDMTTSFKLNLESQERPGLPYEHPMASELYTKDISVNLPTGVSGSIVSVPQCPMYDLTENGPGCPTSSQVGVVRLYFDVPGSPLDEYDDFEGSVSPVYNMVPSDGGTAELAFPVVTVVQPVIVTARTDGDYGLTAQTTNISQVLAFDGLTLTLWGVPADPRHDPERFLPENGTPCACFVRHPNGATDSAPLTAYLTNPTKCSGPLNATFISDSWLHPGLFDPEDGRPDLSAPNWVTDTTPMYPDGITGCDKLRFNPSLTVTPDTTKADSPSGYSIHLHVPQSIAPGDLASPALENAVATLPQGLAISPGAADGLQACTDNASEPPGSPGNEIGLTNAESNVFSDHEVECPNASQVGTVEVLTPLLPNALLGQVYLSADHSGDTYAVFFAIRGDGLLVKLKSTVFANPVTGQLTATFAHNPELPFSDFILHFYGGPRAVFVNPQECGPATTTIDLTPWSAGPGGTGDATPSSTFDVSFDGEGAPCPFPQPFEPSFTAGTTNIQAGSFSPLSVTFSRPDADEQVNHVQVTSPPGLLGSLASVPLCPEPQAAEGTCSSASQIGHVTVASGSGAAPLFLPIPGQPPNPVYLTGPYKGAPFGLTMVVPAIAGPYNLGNVVVRATINVNPTTAALTVTSDPLPTILDGIPVQVKEVNVLIDRPDFVFNPTNCSPMSIAGSMTSLQGSTATFSTPFQVTGCGDLGFKPEFKVSVSGRTSRADGTSIDAKLSFPKGAFGTEANIARVRVELPKQLPSRLTTLQKACPAATFEGNPGSCPSASIIGIARASTPILPVGISGPVYFVSHGGSAFPDLIIVLQGDGVRVDLTGSTFISKAGITSTTFATIPDVPVDSFELYLPEGPDSALAANANLCKSTLSMPTSFTAQNGIAINRSTPITVTGCGARASKASRARGARRARAAGAGAPHEHGGTGRADWVSRQDTPNERGNR
jgi:hypothetical protein